MTTEEQNIEILTAKLNALENESRRILGALRWSTKVRLILVTGLILFVLVFSFSFYRLYDDVKNRRLIEAQRIINEQPQEFSAPLTRQLIAMAEEQGPQVGTIFRAQIEKDSQKYVAAMDKEREAFINNMEKALDKKLSNAHEEVMSQHEAILTDEFPELVDNNKLQIIRDNMQSIYTQVGKRYYVDVMGDRMREVVGKLDNFPSTVPRQVGIPVGEQIASEMLELIRMMIIYSENYVPPEDEEQVTSLNTNSTQEVADRSSENNVESVGKVSEGDSNENDAETTDTNNDG